MTTKTEVDDNLPVLTNIKEALEHCLLIAEGWYEGGTASQVADEIRGLVARRRGYQLAYYAHCMNLYGSKQESRDIEMLKSLGFAVINPNDASIEAVMATLPTSDERMAYFESFATECDVIAFRALPDGSIPSGVAKEIGWFTALGKPVLELPSGIQRRIISREATREYLSEIGQR